MISPDARRIKAVQFLGDPRLTKQQAEIVLALYAEADGPLDHYDIENALTGQAERADPRLLVKVQVCRIRARFQANPIITRRLAGYELAPGLRTLLNNLLAHRVAA